MNTRILVRGTMAASIVGLSLLSGCSDNGAMSPGPGGGASTGAAGSTNFPGVPASPEGYGGREPLGNP